MIDPSDVEIVVENPYPMDELWKRYITIFNLLTPILWILFAGVTSDSAGVFTSGIATIIENPWTENSVIWFIAATGSAAALTEWQVFYRNAPGEIKQNLSKSFPRVFIRHSIKFGICAVLYATLLAIVINEGSVWYLLIYSGVFLLGPGFQSTTAVHDLSRAHGKYRRLAKRVKKIEEAEEPRETVDITPSLEEIQPDQYETVPEAIEVLEIYESELEAVEEKQQMWEDARGKEEELQNAISALDKSLHPGMYRDLVKKYQSYNVEKYTSPESALKRAEDLAEAGKQYAKMMALRETATNMIATGEKLQKKYPKYSYDEFLETAEKKYTVTREDIKDSSQYKADVEEGETIVLKSDSVATFLESGDTSHSKAKPRGWTYAINRSLEEFSSEYVMKAAIKIEQIQQQQAREEHYKKEREMDRRRNSNRRSRSGSTRWKKSMLYQYSWQEFEELVGELYRANGYRVTVTQGTNDGGVDVWARKESEVVAIQVKQYQSGSKVGRPDLQRITSLIATGEATKVAVVTSSSFSSAALEYSRDLGEQMKLIDGDGMVRLLSDANVPM